MILKSGAEYADQPLVAQAVMDGRRTAIPSDFTKVELIALRAFAPEITDSELQARISDLVWVTTRHFASASIAILAYLQAARILVDEGKWAVAIKRLERALRLSTKLRQNDSSSHVDLINYINQLLGRSDLNDGKHFGRVERLMTLLLEFDEGDSLTYSHQSSTLALAAEQAQDWLQARDYWMLNARWCHRLGDEGGTKAARLRKCSHFRACGRPGTQWNLAKSWHRSRLFG